MTKSNNEWVPEVGQVCEIIFDSDGSPFWFPIEWYGTKDGKPIFYDLENTIPEIVWAESSNYRVRPIKTEAEKRREIQLEMIRNKLDAALDVDDAMAAILYKAGVRVLSDDQFIATKLSDEDVSKIVHRYLPTAERITAKEVAELVRVFMGQPP